MLYLDNAATTQPASEVLESMLPYYTDYWFNPSSGYRASRKASDAIDEARSQVASLIGAKPSEIYFTSGGTESNNTILESVHRSLPTDAVFASTAIEHSSVLRPLESLEERGRSVHYLPVSSDAILQLDALAKISPSVISVMWANNEVGSIQPIEDLSNWAQNNQAVLMVDAIQAVGKIPINVQETRIDFMSLSAHKFHGPKGVGALYIREGLSSHPLLRGGGQESGLRSGTENTAGIVGMGIAATMAQTRLQHSPPSSLVRDTFEQAIKEVLPSARINAQTADRLPQVSHISFEGCEAEGLVILLDEYGLACSSGSACMTGKQQPSHVQKAMGFTDKEAKSSLRFSFDHSHTTDDAQKAAQLVKKAVEKLKSVQNSTVGPVVIYTP